MIVIIRMKNNDLWIDVFREVSVKYWILKYLKVWNKKEKEF